MRNIPKGLCLFPERTPPIVTRVVVALIAFTAVSAPALAQNETSRPRWAPREFARPARRVRHLVQAPAPIFFAIEAQSELRV